MRSLAGKSKGASQGQLRLESARAAAEVRLERARATEEERTRRTPESIEDDEPAIAPTNHADDLPATPFGAWLVKQKGSRSETIDALAKAAAADPRFPKAGDPDAVREYIGKKGADPDTFEAIDDAEAAWLRG